MAVFSLTPVYSVPSPSPVPQSEFSEDPRLRTSSRVLRTGRITASALSQRSRPDSPCAASIPSKYRTVFYQLSENKGFQMQSPRFDSNRFFTEAPSPGTYDIKHDSFIRNDTSLSTRGTCYFGSKTKRFLKEKSLILGPASYFPAVLKNDFNRSNTTRLFKEPLIQELDRRDTSPSPNKYDLRSKDTSGPDKKEDSIFKSKTPRILDSTHTVSSIPGPGRYNVDHTPTHALPTNYSSVFKSKSNRPGVFQKILSPGPAEYSPHSNNTKQQNKPKTIRRHTLTLSAPAQPMTSLLSFPGPGTYEVTERVRSVQGKRTRSRSDYIIKPSACFQSTARELQPQSDRDIPGPASYKPRTVQSRHSFIQNPAQKWV